MIGSRVIKIAIIATVLTAIAAGAIVVLVILTNRKVDICTPKDLHFSQINNVLKIEWEDGGCDETYAVSVYVDGELTINNLPVHENVYYYNNANIACTQLIVTVAVGGQEGESITKAFIPEIGAVTDLLVNDWKVTWNNQYLSRCKFEVQVDSGPIIPIEVGNNIYELGDDLKACKEYTVTVTPVSPANQKGTPARENFDIASWIDWGFTIEDVSTVERIPLRATWTNNNPECVYSVYYKSDDAVKVCAEVSGSECNIAFDEEELKTCHSYEFELRGSSSNDPEQSIAVGFYSPSTSTVVDFTVEYDSFKTIATWNYLGPACKYQLMLGSEENTLDVDDSSSSDGLYTYQIPNENLDLCTTTQISLIAKSSSGVEVAKSNFEYKPVPAIEELELKSDTKILAEWRSLGENCLYNVKYKGESKTEIQDDSVYIDDVFGIATDYCASHTVSVSVTTTNDKTGDPTEKTITKALIEGFEGISEKDMVIILLIGKIEWKLLDGFGECEDMHYMVSCSVDGKEPDMEPEAVNEPSYTIDKNLIDSKTRTLHTYIQPLQKSVFGDIIGSTQKCDFTVDFDAGQADLSSCEYILYEKKNLVQR